MCCGTALARVGQAAAVAAAAAGTNNGGGVQCMHALPRLLQRKLPHDLSSGDALAFVADEKHGFSALCDLAASMHIAQNAAMMPAKPTSCCGEESNCCVKAKSIEGGLSMQHLLRKRMRASTRASAMQLRVHTTVVVSSAAMWLLPR